MPRGPGASIRQDQSVFSRAAKIGTGKRPCHHKRPPPKPTFPDSARPSSPIFPATRTKHSLNSLPRFADHFPLPAHTYSMIDDLTREAESSTTYRLLAYRYWLPAAQCLLTSNHRSRASHHLTPVNLRVCGLRTRKWVWEVWHRYGRPVNPLLSNMEVGHTGGVGGGTKR